MMLAVANREDLGALAKYRPEIKWEEDMDAPLRTRNNGRTAIFNAQGVCFRYANFFTMFCGGTTYESLAMQAQAAEDDGTIENAILLLDTPGGVVNGCAELVGIFENFSKPLVAYVDGDACSAGYWMASACDHIVASRTSQLGCLGVVGVYTDNRKQLEQQGLREYELVSTLTPNKRPDVTTDAGRSEIMRNIDALAEVFLDDVARLRGFKGGAKGVSKATNGGAVFVGQHAVDVGLADEIGTFEDVVASLGKPFRQASKKIV